MKNPTRLTRHIPAYVAALVIVAAFFIFGTGTAAAQAGCTVTVGDGQIIVSSACVVVTATPSAEQPTATPAAPTNTPAPPTAVPTATETPVPPPPTATPVVLPTATTEPSTPIATGPGIWISQAEIDALPTSGAGWNDVLAAANADPGTPSLSNQDSNNSTSIMANALVCAKTKIQTFCDKVTSALKTVAAGNLPVDRALALGRELVGYVLSADIIGLKDRDPTLDAQFRSTISALRTKKTASGPGSLVECDNERPNNWGGHCGASRIAVDLYIGDKADLDKAAKVLQGWLGDRSAYAGFTYGALDWQSDPSKPVGVLPVGAKLAAIPGRDVSGAQPEELRRAGEVHWPPTFTDYGWEGLQGRLASAKMLSRAGYPAFEWSDKAILRAANFLYSINWPATGDDQWQPWVINKAYGVNIPTTGGGKGKNVGWTMWTEQ